MTADEAIALIRAEVAKATTKFPTWPTDPIHAGNVVGEEAGELAKAILQAVREPQKSGAEDVLTEAIQTGAMAVRFVMSMTRYKFKMCKQHVQDDEPTLCRECGANMAPCLDRGATHCNPPFRVQPHKWGRA